MAMAIVVSAFSMVGFSARSARAQGCVLIRQSAPLIGQGMSTDLQPGEWEFSFSTRASTADKHYSLDEEQTQRQTLGTYVVNKQRAYDFALRYQVNQRFGVAASIPVIDASWALPSPLAPAPGPRVPQTGQGFGDLTVSGRYWLLDPGSHFRGNVAIAAGVKMPTGKADVAGFYPTLAGAWSEKAIDQSAQPGDGGWGIVMDAQSFLKIRKGIVFGSVSYLANPRNENDTPSIIAGLGLGGPAFANKMVNSVADQYLVRVGGAMSVPKTRHLSASLSFRAEGLRRYDVFGRADGFRRPGYELYLEPGAAYSVGAQSFSFYVPVGLRRMREPDPYTGVNGDATFPDYVFLGNYSIRFGGPKRASTPVRPPVPNPPVSQ